LKALKRDIVGRYIRKLRKKRQREAAKQGTAEGQIGLEAKAEEKKEEGKATTLMWITM